MKILILLLIVNHVFSLKSSDLCLTSQRECKKAANSNLNRVCDLLKCSGNYSYQCSPKHCTTSETVCRELFNLGYKLKSLSSLRAKMSVETLYNQKMSEYLNIIKNVRDCPLRRYEVSIDDVCLSGQGCQLKQDFPLRYGEITIVSAIDCPCEGDFKVKCGKKYCAKSKHTCDEFILKQKNGNFVDMGECGNEKKIIHEKSIFEKHQRLDFLF